MKLRFCLVCPVVFFLGFVSLLSDSVDAAEGKSWPMISIERYAFYERAKQAYCVIQTGERRFYGCFAFRKGVVPPDAK
jgi:L-fucose mutarotase